MTHVTATNDLRSFVRKRLPEVIQVRQDKAAEGLREYIRTGLKRSGELHNDTGALAEGLYIKSERGSDYQERRGEAQAAYVGASSGWRDKVRMMVSGDAYTAAHFAERAASEIELEAHTDEVVTVLACMMVYGYFYQYGHDNVFTGKWEQRSWFIEPMSQWGTAHLHKYFLNIEADLI